MSDLSPYFLAPFRYFGPRQIRPPPARPVALQNAPKSEANTATPKET